MFAKMLPILFFLIVPFSATSAGERPDSARAFAGKTALLLSYFIGNGEDGLHLAWSSDGLVWTPLNRGRSFLTPSVGREKLMRDPNILLGPDGLFHMVWTTSWQDTTIGYASSRDLIHWSEQRALPVMAHEPASRNCWAPELYFDDASRRFLVFWATTIPGRFPETDASGDGGYNHRMYYTATHDFLTFSPSRLLYDPGFNVIDATIVRDGNRYFMILKDETRNPPKKNLRLAFAEHPEGLWSPAGPPFTGNYWAEGPSVLHSGDDWFVYFDKYMEGRYGLITSPDLKTWTDRSGELRFPDGARHGTVFRAPWAVLEKLLKEN